VATDATPLTKAQLETLRGRLEEERARILRVLQASAAPDPPGEQETEIEEAAQRETERTHQVEIARRERALLGEVEHALQKLAGGKYGVSEATGDPIPYERLAAVPWARQGVDE
jgi:RNA polymerase-binding transcription factor